MRAGLIGAAAAAILAGSAVATGPAAWSAFDQTVGRACAAASGLARPRRSAVVGFDDSLGKVAVLVAGTETVRARRGTQAIAATRLCIYDKRTRRTWIDEAAGWSAPIR